MPVTIDIKQDARYQQGVEEGVEQKAFDTARRMFESGLEFSLIQNVTGLEKTKLEEIAKSISKS